MPRERHKKTSDVPTRIYSYRCLPPIAEEKRVEDFVLGTVVLVRSAPAP